MSDACEERVRRAVNALCTCGGRGPYDADACLACLVWHEYRRVEEEFVEVLYDATAETEPACVSPVSDDPDCVSQSGKSETEGGAS